MTTTPIRDTHLVRLDPSTPLPCSILQPDGSTCGKPATGAYARPLPPRLPFLIAGLWELQPICRECAIEAAQVHLAADPAHTLTD